MLLGWCCAACASALANVGDKCVVITGWQHIQDWLTHRVDFTGDFRQVLVENKVKVDGVSKKLLPIREKAVYHVVKMVTPVTYLLANLDTGKGLLRSRNQLIPYVPMVENMPKQFDNYIESKKLLM